MSRKTNPDFLNGVPELLIFRLLGRKPMHGYDLVQAIRLASGARLEFAEGCIYPILHRLEKQGLLSCTRELVSGRTRIIYQVTKPGHRRYQESLNSWREIVAAVGHVLQGGEHGTSALG